MTTTIVLSLLTCFGAKCAEQTKFNIDTTTIVSYQSHAVTYCDARQYEWPINREHLTNCAPKESCYVTDSQYGTRLVSESCGSIKKAVLKAEALDAGSTDNKYKYPSPPKEEPSDESVNNNEGRPVNMEDPNLRKKPRDYTEGQFNLNEGK